jgi:hypothetical protein
MRLSARCLSVLTMCLLLAASGAQAEADPAPLQMLPNDDNGSAQCGPYTVTWSNNRSFQFNVPGSATLRAVAGGRPVLDVSRRLLAGEKLIMLWCGAVLGDGSQALAYESFSGGAHCCFSPTIVQLQPGARHLLDADLGNGGLNQPEQPEEGGPFILPATSDVFAYFDDLSFAASPFMPLIFAYDGTAYVEATNHFPDRLLAEAAQAESDLGEVVARGINSQIPPQYAFDAQKSLALRLYGLHVLLGDAEQVLPAIQAEVAPPVAAWLEANAPAASDALAQRYQLDAPSPSD